MAEICSCTLPSDIWKNDAFAVRRPASSLTLLACRFGFTIGALRPAGAFHEIDGGFGAGVPAQFPSPVGCTCPGWAAAPAVADAEPAGTTTTAIAASTAATIIPGAFTIRRRRLSRPVITGHLLVQRTLVGAPRRARVHHVNKHA